MTDIHSNNETQPIPHYYQLGATLYMPANRDDLAEILSGQKLSTLRSLVLCTEDSVHISDIPLCLANLRKALHGTVRKGLMVFVRPRSPRVLEQILKVPCINRITGFVLPKLDSSNLETYRSILAHHPGLSIMPTLETAIAFDRAHIIQFGKDLRRFSNEVICVRIGGNDLCALLGIRRPSDFVIYDTPVRSVMDDAIIALRPQGIEISAPVFESWRDTSVLKAELALDKLRGLFAKTAIHPTQVPIIEHALSVSEDDLGDAQTLLTAAVAPVYATGERMYEAATHLPWATRVILAGRRTKLCAL
jgi:citrate lyase beta subunit